MQSDKHGEYALRLEAVDKSFDGQAALHEADFVARWGEVHALLGENGAGKSTLMNIACGLYTADQGRITVQGQTNSITSPSDASRLGVGMVHQHYKLVGPFSVAENLLLSCGHILDIKSVSQISAQAVAVAEELGFSIQLRARTDTLSIAERQRIEIVKLILQGADILILDEPTAVLTDKESDAILSLLRDLARSGKAVVLITHRLRDVRQYADKVTVMRGGSTVLGSVPASTFNENELAVAMVGEALPRNNAGHRERSSNGAIRLQLQQVSVTGDRASMALSNVDLDVRAGEIVGVAGVGGNGQTELATAIFGLSALASGNITVDATDLAGMSIQNRRNLGLRLVPADRFRFGLLSELKAYENLAITNLTTGQNGSAWWLSRRAMKASAAAVFRDHSIVGGTPATLTRLLSGGNAQKLLLARELNNDASVLVVQSPTRGLDVRAYRAVHNSIIEFVGSGAACLLISEDLDEVLQIADRVGVLSRGQLHGPFPTDQIDRNRIGELMAGHA